LTLRQTICFAAFTVPQKTYAGFAMQQKHLVVLANQDYKNNKHDLNNGYREI
jgi:hypothetical protein